MANTATLAVLATMATLGAAQFPPLPGSGSIVPPLPRPDASYWVMCPNKVRRGHDLVCSARILQGSSPVAVSLTLRDYRGKKVILRSRAQNVFPGDASELRIPIRGDLEKPSEERWYNDYNVTVEGVGSEVNFREFGRLSLAEESMAVFVQTDKGIYKFGQQVKFRVLMTTIDLKPISNVPADIIIEDPNENRIWQKLGQMGSSGVIDQFSLQIPDRAPTGTWTIKVTANGIEESVTFEVDNYVLPKFEVDVILPPFGLTYNPVLDVTVKAKYTFGKPVTEGFVSLLLKKSWAWRGEPLRVRGKLDKNGEFKAQFSKTQLLDYVRSTLSYKPREVTLSWTTLVVEANVTESNTLRTRPGEGRIQYYDTPLKIDFMDISPSNYKSGLSYTGYVQFRKQDDTELTPEELAGIQVRFNVTYEVLRPTTTTSTTTTTTTTPLKPGELGPPGIDEELIAIRPPIWPGYQPRDTKVLDIANPVRQADVKGWMPISFDVPSEAKSVYIRVEGLGKFTKVDTSKYLSESHSPTDSFLQLSVPPSQSKSKVGDVLNIKAKSTSPVEELFYQVFAKGLMLKFDSIRPASPSTDLTINIALTQMMAPSLRVLAFYRVQDNDEFVVDALSLSVEGIFQYPVSVSFSKSPVQPGEGVDVLVKAAQNSLVFLAANDKSVNLLKKANDITQELVTEFMFSLDYGSSFPYWRNMMTCWVPYYFGGNDASAAFSSANVVVFTDALVYRHRLPFRPEVAYGVHYDSGPVGPVGPMSLGRRGPTAQRKNSRGFSPAAKVRKLFPENWLWGSYLADASGEAIVPTTAPDTITAWVTTAFSMHPQMGLSVAEKPAELITRRDMFVTLDLPLSIVQNEDYCFTASVFNYYKEDLEVLVNVIKSSNFKNIQLRNRPGTKQVDIVRKSGYVSKYMGYVPKDGVESTMFCITPTTVGRIPLQVQALTRVPGLSDAVERVIKVKPEGVPRASSSAYLVDLERGRWSQTLQFSFPPDTVQGSQYLTFSATGNFLGPVLDNIDDLLRMPYGCGEQNMINFAPTVFLSEYYFKTNSMDEEKLEKARKYMLAGYTKELTYEHEKSGSYSAFGCKEDCSSKNGSLWLTAFVMKTLAQGEQLNQYQDVFALDHKVLERSATWMARQVDKSGEFKEYGKVFNSRMQGGSSQGEALTAYSIIALYEASKVFQGSKDTRVSSLISNTINKGRDYLDSKLLMIRDPYDACIVSYALQLTGSRMKDEAYQMTERMATVGDGLKFWARPRSGPPPKYAWQRTEDALSIEATAYCLLLRRERGEGIDSMLPSLRWLTNQRGPNGGFISTQDTVIGLQALTSVSAGLFAGQAAPLTVRLSWQDAQNNLEQRVINLNSANQMMLQKVEIPYQNGQPRSVQVDAQDENGMTGPTSAMVELVMDYNVKSGTDPVSYDTSHDLMTMPGDTGFTLMLKIRTITREPSSMTTLRVEVPAGYSVDTEMLEMNKFISRIEMKDDDLICYFEAGVIKYRGVEVMINMIAPASGALINPKDKSYTVSNYYQPSDEVTKMYSIQDNKPFCEKAKDFSICKFNRS